MLSFEVAFLRRLVFIYIQTVVLSIFDPAGTHKRA